jgi:hypothetical protein
MPKTGPRGPRWNYYGQGVITLHLASGQSIDVEVATFKCRYLPDEGRDEYEWTYDGDDTLPVVPAASQVVAVEHHPRPRRPANVTTTTDHPVSEEVQQLMRAQVVAMLDAAKRPDASESEAP